MLKYHYLHQQHISRLGRLNLKRPGKVMDSSEVDIFHIVGAVIVSYIAINNSGEPLDFSDLPI